MLQELEADEWHGLYVKEAVLDEVGVEFAHFLEVENGFRVGG
jgi:hypothetical protein